MSMPAPGNMPMTLPMVALVAQTGVRRFTSERLSRMEPMYGNARDSPDSPRSRTMSVISSNTDATPNRPTSKGTNGTPSIRFTLSNV